MKEVHTSIPMAVVLRKIISSLCLLEATSRHLEGLMTHSAAVRSFRRCVQGMARAFMDLWSLLMV